MISVILNRKRPRTRPSVQGSRTWPGDYVPHLDKLHFSLDLPVGKGRVALIGFQFRLLWNSVVPRPRKAGRKFEGIDRSILQKLPCRLGGIRNEKLVPREV